MMYCAPGVREFSGKMVWYSEVHGSPICRIKGCSREADRIVYYDAGAKHVAYCPNHGDKHKVIAVFVEPLPSTVDEKLYADFDPIAGF